ncbi:MAG: MMPL family transporter [Planctomycetota bacterium]
MQGRLSHRWSKWIIGHCGWIVLAWLLFAVLSRLFAPSWKQIAYDGDFDYLPARMTSVAGGKLLDQAFPGERSRSQIVLVMGRDEQPLIASDDAVALDLLRRLSHRLGQACWRRAIQYGYQGGPADDESNAGRWLRRAKQAFDHSIESDERFYTMVVDRLPEVEATITEPRMAIAFLDRGRLVESMQGPPEDYGADFEAAIILSPDIASFPPIEERPLEPWDSLLDVLAWDDSVVGARLKNDTAKLVVLNLSTELAATQNIETVEAAEQLINQTLQYSARFSEPGLLLRMTGSAAIGGETLLAARDAIQYTELFTVVAILLILACVYRAPLLIAVPLVSIGVAVIVAMGLVAFLTQWSMDGTVPLLDLRVFTTSRIFVVVLLFGAGTDYCLFLISRLREEAGRMDWKQACHRSLGEVTGALLGSALTTILGLGMMWFAQFGKFHYTGPIIAICLLVGLAVCTSLTPALLYLLGPRVFWPTRVQPQAQPISLIGSSDPSNRYGLWSAIALAITRHPRTSLTLGLILLLIPASMGWRGERSVTYDLSSQLEPGSRSRQGLRLLSQSFQLGEISPVTVLLERESDRPRPEFETEIKTLADQLYSVPGVAAVRTFDDPMGDYPPDRRMNALSKDTYVRLALRNHRLSKNYFFATDPRWKDRLARLDVVVEGDPFAIETGELVSNMRTAITDHLSQTVDQWGSTRVLLTGTTPSITDLRQVTLSDNRTIKFAVVMSVFIVLISLIRRFWLCVYLIFTVLLSYYATLGITIATFRFLYGDDYVGLDWKLPLFLFVILVAVGQDYNVYLVTRIVEEERRLGWMSALRRAVSRTGGIITACGLVMAATFLSMTTSAWLPSILNSVGIDAGSATTLRGITELGFALGLGVLIDTFYVRTVLVPSFVAIMGKRSRLVS